MTPPAPPAQLILGPPVSWGGRLLVPLVRRVDLSRGAGGMVLGDPVALLIREGGAWSFVPLGDGIGQDILARLDLPPPGW